MKNPIRKELYILGFSRVTRSIAAGMINLAFPYYILQNLHYGAFVLGLIYVAATVATAGLGLLTGIMTDVWGKRKTLILASALLPISALMIYLSSNLWMILPAAMLGGYSATGSLAGGGIGGAVQPIQSAVLASLTTGETRTKYFSIFTFLAGATGALGALLAKLFSVQDIFLTSAIISALGVPVLWLVRLSEARGKMGKLKTGTTIGKFTLTGILNGFSQGLIMPFLIPFFVLVYHIPKSEMSEYAFVSGLLGSFAILTAPRLERHFGFVKSIVVSRGAGTVLMVIFPIIRWLPLSIIIYLITPALRIAALPIQQSELTKRVADDEMGRALGINQVARLAASSSGTGLSGYLMDTSFFEIPFFLYGAIMAANLYLYIRFFGKRGSEPIEE